MTYPKIVLQKARELLKKRQENNKLISKQKKEEIYKKFPELKMLNINIATIIKSALSENSDSAEIKYNISKLSKQREEFLKGKGLPINFLDDYYECPLCNDEGFVDGKICSCYLKIIKEEAYNLSNLKEKIKIENFQTFDFSIHSEKKQIEYIYDICKKYCLADKTVKKNLLFTGSTGTGKTFLSSCIAKYFLDNEKTVLYLTSTKILNIIDDAKFNKSKSQELNEYLDFVNSCDLLIIDDLGTEYSFPYPQSQLFDILQNRLINCKNTVISTNLGFNELTTKYSQRFVSRILGEYEVLVFKGKDLRHNFQ